ncbi:MAG TPA: response regulator [Polyangiaceae bacterium]|jgi:signal transduction histidine kinase|nr:response regulator [Polyangiaceae bacterium]
MSDTKAPANVLVVDDTPDNLRLLTGILEELGYEVRPATSGAHALQAAEHAPPDLVLLDVTMPEMNGYEVCVRLKASAKLKDIPVIFLTALTDIADKVKAFEVGGVDYITKPFHIAEVQARVRTHLALRIANLELIRSYAKLQELEQLREDLVHMVIHDMRSPLTVLGGHLGFLKDECDKLSPDAAGDLEAALHSAQVIARMANDLLDVSRLEEGKLPLRLADVDLGELAQAVKTSLRGFERGRAIELNVASRTIIACDAAIVHRILENLVNNAIKHTPAGSAIQISLLDRSDCARIAVSDRGPGVPLEARAKIFEKFGAAAARREAGYHSAGLGLAFCKLAVEAHGGAIGVESVEPSGSTFWFELPRSASPGAAARSTRSVSPLLRQ